MLKHTGHIDYDYKNSYHFLNYEEGLKKPPKLLNGSQKGQEWKLQLQFKMAIYIHNWQT